MLVELSNEVDGKAYHDAVLHLHASDLQGLEELGWRRAAWLRF